MTEGSLHFSSGKSEWVITTTPDVTMRLKRIFPRMVQSVATELRVTATAEVANDLEWVLVRFPLNMSAEDADRLRVAAEHHRAKLRELEAIVTAPPAANQFKLAVPLRDYQTIGTALYLAQQHLLLADEVGLGKSATAIGSLSDKRTLPALVVVKAHLAGQWVQEIKKFIPDAWVHVVKQMKEYPLPPADVYVITYSKLASWWGFLAKKVRSVIYDEIQELRVRASEKYKAAKLLNDVVPFKIGLSATPIHNYGGEIWNVVSLLSPDTLGSEGEFCREWCDYRGNGKWVVKDPVALGHYLRKQKIMLRRTRKDVGRELPSVMRYVQEVAFDRDIYEKSVGAADELARTILAGTFVERGQAAREFDLKLRQATGVAKAPYVAEIVRMLVESGEKVLLGGWHHAVYEVWKKRLADLNPVFFTGMESEAQKERSRMAFINGESDVMVMSLRSGSGLNGLQDVCSICVLGELDWTPAVHEQLVGRLRRDGDRSDQHVQVFIPVAPVGSDPTMASVLGLKQAQAVGIVDLGTESTPSLLDTDPARVRQLALDYLKARKLPVPTAPAAAA